MTELPTAEHVTPRGQHASEAAGDTFDLGAIHAMARVIAALGPHVRLRVRAHPAFVRLDRALDRDSGLDLAFALALARVFAVDLDRDRDRDLDRARDRDRALAVDLDLALDLALDRDDLDRDRDDLDRDRDDLALARAALAQALDDFTETDLRDVDLTNVPLEGLRWSSDTRWPPGWAEQVERNSVEVAPGVFEVRRRSPHAPAHAPAPV